MIILAFGLPSLVPYFSTALTTDIPSVTCPKTTCLQSIIFQYCVNKFQTNNNYIPNHGVLTVVIKNCEPLVFLPELAIESKPVYKCHKISKFSTPTYLIVL